VGSLLIYSAALRSCVRRAPPTRSLSFDTWRLKSDIFGAKRLKPEDVIAIHWSRYTSVTKKRIWGGL